MTPREMISRGVPRKEIRRYLRTEAAKYGRRLVEISLPGRVSGRAGAPVRALRSKDFLVQVFDEGSSLLRVSVNRTDIDAEGNWRDGITWDELQRLKAEAGYGEREAVEVYPPDAALVDVASIRHLWILPEGQRMPFSWNQGGPR